MIRKVKYRVGYCSKSVKGVRMCDAWYREVLSICVGSQGGRDYVHASRLMEQVK